MQRDSRQLTDVALFVSGGICDRIGLSEKVVGESGKSTLFTMADRDGAALTAYDTFCVLCPNREAETRGIGESGLTRTDMKWSFVSRIRSHRFQRISQCNRREPR